MVLTALAGSAATAAESSNPSVANIQRTMARIAASTPAKPATVRLQFYGQSITAQGWTTLVEKDLARRFPCVKFVFQNAAIGGFTSPALIRTAEHDCILGIPISWCSTSTARSTSTRRSSATSAPGPRPKSCSGPATYRQRDAGQASRRQSADRGHPPDRQEVRLPADRRAEEMDRLPPAEALAPPALLRDGVHLNDAGVELLASFIAPELVRVPGWPPRRFRHRGRHSVGRPGGGPGRRGRPDLSFTGNRVVAISGGAGQGGADVLLDGQPMLGLASCGPSAAPASRRRCGCRPSSRSVREGPLGRGLDFDLPLRLLPDGNACISRWWARKPATMAEASARRFVSKSARSHRAGRLASAGAWGTRSSSFPRDSRSSGRPIRSSRAATSRGRPEGRPCWCRIAGTGGTS